MSVSTNETRSVLWTEIIAVAKHLGKRAWQPIKNPSVIQLKEGAVETPVYLIGAGLTELHLARLIYSERPIFGVDIPLHSAWRNAAAKHQSDALPTMEQLVARYVAALSVHARTSPCVLAGHSFNGLIAFEAAHQLNRQGGKVEMVMLVDTELKDPHHVAWRQLQKDWKQPFNGRTLKSVASRLGSSWSIIRWMLVKEMRRLGRHFLTVVVRNPGKLTTSFDEEGLPWHWGFLELLYSNALRSYHARCLDCSGVFFRAEPESPVDGSVDWHNLFSRGLEIIQVSGSHDTVMQQPHTITLAREMSKVLDRFRVGSSTEVTASGSLAPPNRDWQDP